MNFSRRKFLGLLGATSVFPGFAADSHTGDHLVGSQLFGWGQYYQRDGKNLGEHMDEVLSALGEMGYEYAEHSLDSGNPEANAAFARQLKSHGLKPVALYTGGRLHEKVAAAKSIERIVAAAKVAAANGFTIINCNPDPIGRSKTDEELKTQAESLNVLGAQLNELHLKLGVHNHTPEMADHAREFHHNFNATDPKKVGFCYDVHWIYRGGIKPEEALKNYGNRVVSWHLRQSREGIWWEDLDNGDVDYSWIANYLKQHSLPRIFSVELALEGGTKITRSVVENHRRSRKFIRTVFGV